MFTAVFAVRFGFSSFIIPFIPFFLVFFVLLALFSCFRLFSYLFASVPLFFGPYDLLFLCTSYART